ncbi:hypothetical protein [Streptomyces sp. NPDC050164]|uniref:hypothetical protein n=1 Tax=Streptomyces sp. NPDC050164 TaxID=3365605 RepID=UPI0037BCED2B
MISKLAMLAKKRIEAAWLNGEAYDLATQAAEALESAQLLQSPETAAELESSPLAWAEQLDAKSLDNFLITLGSATEHEPMDEAIEQIHEVIRSFREALTGADGITRRIAPTQALRDGDQDKAPALVIYRASWDTMRLGRYTTDAEARKHCEDHARRDLPSAVFDWIEDEEDGVAELVATVDGDEGPTGYTVTALEIASKYDPEADE